jgi:hypothetical protein
MEDRPSRLAFCKILFGRHGGTFTANGMPIFGADEARGDCDRGFDCGECNLMNEWLVELANQGWSWGWECDKCLKDTKKTDEEEGIARFAQGFYQSGRVEKDPDDLTAPTLTGCTRCGWESFFNSY